jgi:hypothetical protein
LPIGPESKRRVTEKSDCQSDRGGNKEFIHFLSISRGSVGKLKSQLYRALDQEYIDDQEFQEAYSLASLTGKQISGLMTCLKNSNRKGFKYPRFSNRQQITDNQCIESTIFLWYIFITIGK